MTEILKISGLCKRFGGTRALDDVALSVQTGEVHALLGHNGSGKSTLIKVLSGYHAPDAGEIWVRGEQVKLPLSAGEPRRLGMAFTHQDLGLVPNLSVLENLRVGRFSTGISRRINWRGETARARKLLAEFGLAVDPRDPVGRLSQTERAIVAIARALDDIESTTGSGLLVLDEPTVSLPEHEVHLLFEAVRRVTGKGSAVLFVTHRLEEVLDVGDQVSVLRDGRRVATEATANLDEDSLVRLIVGADLGELYPSVTERVTDPVLTVTGLSGSIARNVSFIVHAGEILGLTGLVGAGHDEVPYLIYGARSPESGSVTVGGMPITRPSPASAKNAGLALLPADRAGLASIPTATLQENVTMPTLGRYARRGWLRGKPERADVEEVLARFDVHPADPQRPFSALSGGNQQKALLGRWMHADPRVLLLDEPTQGVDVAACKGIFEILSESAEAGKSVLYSSTDYDDLANLCHRVLVFRRGRIVGELTGDALTHDRIVERCYAGSAQEGSIDP